MDFITIRFSLNRAKKTSKRLDGLVSLVQKCVMLLHCAKRTLTKGRSSECNQLKNSSKPLEKPKGTIDAIKFMGVFIPAATT